MFKFSTNQKQELLMVVMSFAISRQNVEDVVTNINPSSLVIIGPAKPSGEINDQYVKS